MNPRVIKVIPKENYSLQILFDNNEWKVFNVNPFLDKGIFRELKNTDLFKTAMASNGTVQWANEADLCPDTLYELSSALVPNEKEFK